MTIIRCTSDSGPPCHDLLDDPDGVLADPDRWPEHFYCESVARESTRRWAYRQAATAFGDDIPDSVHEWLNTWPLPVMRTDNPFAPSERMNVPPLLLPLEGWPVTWFAGPAPLAALILELENPHASVTAFGLLNVAEGWPVRMQFTTVGTAHDSVTTFQKRVAKWWQGENFTGAPHGKRLTRIEADAAFRDYRRRMGRGPTQLQLAAELGCSERQVRHIVGAWKPYYRENTERYEMLGRARKALRARQTGK